MLHISIHAPRRGSDDRVLAVSSNNSAISIHAPRRGSDWQRNLPPSAIAAFQSTLPAGGATSAAATPILTHSFQSTLPAGGATVGVDGGDRHHSISIHAPRRGSDLISKVLSGFGLGFQSTLPAGGATGTYRDCKDCNEDFNPRSPQGERLNAIATLSLPPLNFNPRSPQGERHLQSGILKFEKSISIHAPRRGSDGPTWSPLCPARFQSTLPAGGAT